MNKLTVVNPHKAHSATLFALVNSIVTYRNLILQMAKREVVGRYKGSVIGLAWSFFNPLLMLAIYTVVFSQIFRLRWQGGNIKESNSEFALILFAGMIIINLFNEILNRAPSLILSNVNYVKKVVFPLETLPIVATSAAIFHALVSLIVLLLAFLMFNGYLQWTIIFLPLVLLPLVIFATGLAWIIASLGVFLRDIAQSIGIITTMMMFLSPVFYPITAVPDKLKSVIMLNPPTFIIEQTRDILIWGKVPNWGGLAIYSSISILIAWLGFAWFQKTRKGFADVI